MEIMSIAKSLDIVNIGVECIGNISGRICSDRRVCLDVAWRDSGVVSIYCRDC